MDGYDLDDTLADVNYDEADTRGLATVFSQAEIKYQPEEDFVVITGRTNSTRQLRDATEAWLVDNFPNYRGTYYVSGTEAQIIQAKARRIEDLDLNSYTDDNLQILEGLAQLLPSSVELYTIEDGQRIRYTR